MSCWEVWATLPRPGVPDLLSEISMAAKWLGVGSAAACAFFLRARLRVERCSILSTALQVGACAVAWLALRGRRKYEVKGACAVVTGASSGIGVVIARRLAAEGVATLILVARREKELRQVADDILKEYPHVATITFQADVTQANDRNAIALRSESLLASCQPLILVNNAAVEHWGRFDSTSAAEIDDMLHVNLGGVIHLTREFLPALVKSRGHVVNITAIAGHAGAPFAHVYCASKAGVIAFTQGLRMELRVLGLGATAHAVCPGVVERVGMGVRLTEEAGVTLCSITRLTGSSYPEDTADAVVRAVVYDEPEIIVNRPPYRPMIVLSHLFPRMAETVAGTPLFKPFISLGEGIEAARRRRH